MYKVNSYFNVLNLKTSYIPDMYVSEDRKQPKTHLFPCEQEKGDMDLCQELFTENCSELE